MPHSHDASSAIQTAEESSGQGIRTAWIGLAGMMATAALQIVIVAVSGSIGLLADTLHNLGHAVTTIPLVIAFKIGQPRSKGYSYGYRRAEDLVGVLISLVIAASVVLIVVESIDALIDPRPLANLGWVFAAASSVRSATSRRRLPNPNRPQDRFGGPDRRGAARARDTFTSIAVVVGWSACGWASRARMRSSACSSRPRSSASCSAR